MTDRAGPHASADWPPRMAVCVGAVVLRDRRVLFVRQAKGASLAGQWSIPWGLVDSGESPEDAALRETREEAGIEAEVVGLLGIQNLPTDGWLGIVFLCRHVAGSPTPDGVETDRAAYLSLDEMGALEEPIEPWCAWLARRVLTVPRAAIPAAPENPYDPRRAFL
ncbi:MAG: NUDIX domain-containing protein [Chloroflexi bacterium]|nr:NUDIX domain-containing protein [Chloroflexota bacterium]